MKYCILSTPASNIFGTDFAKASEKLASLVDSAIREGWTPSGGVAVGHASIFGQRPFLFQAMVKTGQDSA